LHGLLTALAAGQTVLTPNTELAAALFDAVEREYRESGRDLWPTPRVRDFDSWLREQYVQRQLSEPELPRCLTDLEEGELWRGIIDSSDLGRDFLDPAAAARAARRARRTLHEYGIPVGAIADDPTEEVRAFFAWNRAFEARCGALRCISSDVLQSGMRDGPIPSIAWIESPQWRPAARRWLSRSAQTLEPQAAVWQAVVSPAAWLLEAASPAAELAAIADWARSNLERQEGFRAWICIPDLRRRRAQVIDAMDAALAPQRFDLRSDPDGASYAVAGGTALAELAPVRTALETLAVNVGLVPFARFSALLRAPELQDSESDTSGAALLDVALRGYADAEADFAAWLALCERVGQREKLGAVGAVRRLDRSRRALASMRGAHRFSDWVSVWIAALQEGPWALRGRWSSVEFQAAERFRELLASLATADALLGTHSEESALRVLLRAARDTAFQAQTGVPAIWVSGQLIDPWLNYSGVWISGCADSQWPAPVEPIALLPVRLQRDYGVICASAETQMRQALDLQNRWQARAPQCVFSCAHSEDGGVNAPSPLLPGSAVPYGAMPAPQPHWRASFEASPDMEYLSDEQAPPFAPEERTHGVATLQAQSRCAFRGFAHSRLAARRLEMPVPGFNRRERGELVHHALEHVWLQLKDSAALAQLTADAQRRLLADAADRALVLVCRRHDPGPRWRQRERIRLQDLLARWLTVERARASFGVEGLEQSPRTARFGGLDFRVRIDRVDLLSDGTRVLIDYKSGAPVADWRGPRPDNPQLPIYALLRPETLVAVAYGAVNADDPGFVAESERGEIFKPSGRSTSLEGMADFAALIKLWSLRIEALAGEFASGRAEVAPTLSACRSCDLHGLCRVPAPLEALEDAYE
jgi:ATP-dependent helicase/nuclease subunit B